MRATGHEVTWEQAKRTESAGGGDAKAEADIGEEEGEAAAGDVGRRGKIVGRKRRGDGGREAEREVATEGEGRGESARGGLRKGGKSIGRITRNKLNICKLTSGEIIMIWACRER